MVTIVRAALGSRRSRAIRCRPRDVAGPIITLLVGALAASAPEYGAVAGAAGVALVAAIVIGFGWASIVVLGHVRRMAGRPLPPIGRRRSAGVVAAGAAIGVVAGVLSGARWGDSGAGDVWAAANGLIAGLIAGGGCVVVARVGGRAIPAVPGRSGALGTRPRPVRRRDVALALTAVALAFAFEHVRTAAVLVPACVAAAVALLAGALAGPVAYWIGVRAVRGSESPPDGRPEVSVSADEDAADRSSADLRPSPPSSVRLVGGAAVACGYMVRRPGVDRLVAVAAAAVALAGAATFAWFAGVDARHDRAVLDLGAARVLTVAPVSEAPVSDVPVSKALVSKALVSEAPVSGSSVSPAALMTAVRDADPSGRYAMAVIVTRAHVDGGSAAGAAIVAADTARLANVVPGGVGTGPTGAELAEILDQSGPDGVAGAVGPITPDAVAIDLPGSSGIGVRTTRLAAPLPGVPSGGVLVDLADVVRAAGTPTGAVATPTISEVWLAAGAPTRIASSLRLHGLQVTATDSVDRRAAQYADIPSVALERFQLAAGAVLLVCAVLLMGGAMTAHRGARTRIRGLALAGGAWTSGLGGALIVRAAGPAGAAPTPGAGISGAGISGVPPLVGTGTFVAYGVASALLLAAPALIVARRHPWRPGTGRPGPAPAGRPPRPERSWVSSSGHMT
jgi:hypothetical protein